MSKFVVVVPRIPNWIHSHVFDEIAESVHFALSALGHDSIQASDFIEGRRAILFGAHIYDLALVPPDTILYSLEQASCVPHLKETFAPFALWDYSTRNIAFWGRGIHVPVGYVPELSRVHMAKEMDIDVLFCGSRSERRIALVSELERRGLRVYWATQIYGAERDALMARAKLAINVHSQVYSEQALFEAVRVSYLLANRIAVVSEESHEGFADGLCFAPYEKLAETCEWYINYDSAREALAESGFRWIKTREMKTFIRLALEETP